MKTATVEQAVESLAVALGRQHTNEMRERLKAMTNGHVTVLTAGTGYATVPKPTAVTVSMIGAGGGGGGHAIPLTRAGRRHLRSGKTSGPMPERGKWKPGSRGRVPAWYKAQQRKAAKR